jgi:hypothetical protein
MARNEAKLHKMITTSSAPAFYTFLSSLLSSFLGVLRRVSHINSYVVRVIDEREGKELRREDDVNARKEDYAVQVKEDSVAALFSLSEMCHTLAAKVLKIRAEASASSSSSSSSSGLLGIFELATGFIENSERITGRQCFHLRAVMVAQAKRFLEVYHDNKKTLLEETLINEKATFFFLPSFPSSLCIPSLHSLTLFFVLFCFVFFNSGYKLPFLLSFNNSQSHSLKVHRRLFQLYVLLVLEQHNLLLLHLPLQSQTNSLLT